jgi:hypothetical protein
MPISIEAIFLRLPMIFAGAIQLHRGSSHNEDRAPMLYLALARVGQDGSADLQSEVDVLKELKRERRYRAHGLAHSMLNPRS